ncbi:MAG: DNA alkylation repair protein [Acutalibacteraceae bacterium]
MSDTLQYVQKRLFELSDESYRDFHAKLIPTVDKAKIIGVRTPVLRKFANEFAKSPNAAEFLDILPHKYYDEDNLHGFLLEKIRNYDELIMRLDRFLPYVDNWATCDLISPKAFAKNKERLKSDALRWMDSSDTYSVRFGIGCLMRYYLDDDFDISLAKEVADIRSGEYYINMMRAWYFATALAKQYDMVLPFFEQQVIDKWTNNKAIQKAKESFRLTPEQKNALNQYKL